MVGFSMRGVGIGGCTSSATCPGHGHEPALCHHMHGALDGDGHYRQPGFQGEQETAGFEPADGPVSASRAFGKDDQRDPIGNQMPPPLQYARPIGIAPVNQQMTCPHQMPAEERKSSERFLGDDAQLKRKGREDDGDVVDALMIRHEHIRFTSASPGRAR